MKAFRVQGTAPMGRKKSTFTIETADENADAARERVVSNIGSRHRVERRFVKITKVEEIPREQVTEPAVEHALENGVAQ